MRADMFLRCKRKKRSTPVQSNHIHVLYRRQYCFFQQRETKMYDTVIKNVKILDGSGAPWYRGDIGITVMNGLSVLLENWGLRGHNLTRLIMMTREKAEAFKTISCRKKSECCSKKCTGVR